MVPAVLNKSFIKDQKQNRKRRKKRRTEDFSDSSSDSEHEMSIASDTTHNITQFSEHGVNIDDIDIQSESEDVNRNFEPEKVSQSTLKLLTSVQLTQTPLSINTSIFKPKNIQNSEEIKEEIDSANAQVDSQYLSLIASEFSNDLDELRKKPDFTEKSLVILAKTLQSGASLFDRDAIDAILKK